MYTKLCIAIHGDTVLYKSIQGYTVLYTAIHGCKQLYTIRQGHTDLYRAIQQLYTLTCAIFNNYYYECTLDMTWYIANEAHSAELAITSLISNKHEWDNCFIKFFKPPKFEVQSKSEKSKKI